jgi:tetratricopeptide (TPR) repeat protein
LQKELLLILSVVSVSGCQAGRTALSAAVVFLTVILVGIWVTRRRNRTSLTGITGAGGPAAGTSQADLSAQNLVPTLRLPQPTEKLPQLLLAVEDARARKDPSEESDLLLELALTYSDAGDYPCALDNLASCLALAPQHTDESFCGHVHLVEARIHLRAKKFDAAEKACQKAASFADKTQNPSLKHQALDRLGDVWTLANQPEKAIAAAKLRLADSGDSVPAWLRLSELLLSARRFDACDDCLDKAHDAAVRARQDLAENRVLAQKARVALVRGEPQRVLALLSGKVERVLTWSELFDSARVLTVYGAAQLELRKFDAAIESFLHHRRLLRHHNDDRVRLLSLLAIAYKQRGQKVDAEACFRDCEKLSNALGPATLTTLVIQSLACLVCEKIQAATFFAQLALDLARSEARPDGESWALWVFSRAQLRLGHADRAVEGLRHALAMLVSPRDVRLESLLHQALGDALSAQNLHEEARASFAIRAAYLKRIGLPD